AHAAAVVDEEFVDDLAALARSFREFGVVHHSHGHALDRTGAFAGVATGAEGLVDIEVPEKDGEGAVALGDIAVHGRVLDRHRLAHKGGEGGSHGLENTDHAPALLAARIAPTRSSREGCLVTR